MQKIRLGVVYGGPSVEHEIAVISAVQAMAAVDKEKYQVIPIFITKKGQWYTGDVLLEMASYSDIEELLKKCTKVNVQANRNEHKLIIPAKGLFGKATGLPLDVILPVMHGAHGEDGCLQGLLELLNIPYGGPGVLGAAVGMDKIMMKAVLAASGLPIIPYQWFTAGEWHSQKNERVLQIEANLQYPVIVKPSNLGSSVGISRADDRDSLVAALDLAATFTNRLLIEHCVSNMREINCSVLGGNGVAKTSVCEEPITDNTILTYQDKYMNGGGSKGDAKGTKGTKAAGRGMSGSSRKIPADLPQALSEEIRTLAKAAFIALDGHGVSRIDMIIDQDLNQVFINEINTIPGSLSFYLWEASGLHFDELIEELIDLALRKQRNKENLTISYDTNILLGFKGGAKGGLKS